MGFSSINSSPLHLHPLPVGEGWGEAPHPAFGHPLPQGEGSTSTNRFAQAEDVFKHLENASFPTDTADNPPLVIAFRKPVHEEILMSCFTRQLGINRQNFAI